MIVAKKDLRVVVKRDAVVKDPPTRCDEPKCSAPLRGVYYQGSDRRHRCARCAMVGGAEMRAKKYVQPRGSSVFHKVEG